MNEEMTILGNDEDFDVIVDGDVGIAKRALMSRKAKKRFPTKPAIALGNQATSSDEVMRRLDDLPTDIVAALADRRKALVDSRYYWNKAANAVASVAMISNADSKGHGTGNVAFAKLDKDNWFLMTGIILLSGVSADVKAAAYGKIALAIANGDFEFRINGGKHVLPKDISCNIFDSARTDIPLGYYKLESPKWVRPESEMFFDIQMSQATAANTAIHLELLGISVVTF